ncbi:AAA family ATPase [Bradyrhizobium sp. AZCC 2289]|uniref:AAA family ATPase n=1 Tax=Bradyrhizobium sp. AZCC 2289 TaxID=3117026 RepID=UPI002FEF76C0
MRNREWMRSLIVQADVAHELHHLDVPNTVCRQRLRQRNAGGAHPFQVSDAEYDQFMRYFVAPGLDEGFNVVVHTA